MTSKLTAKQQAFCEEYMIDLNGSKAAVRAGYSADTANVKASQLLSIVKIREEIAKLSATRSAQTELTAEWVLNNLKEIAARCMTAVPVMERVGNRMVPTGEYKFDSSGAIKANELIGKHLGMFVDRIDLRHTGNAALARKIIDVSNDVGVDPPDLRIGA